jgi:hypothetical protein
MGRFIGVLAEELEGLELKMFWIVLGRSEETWRVSAD